MFSPEIQKEVAGSKLQKAQLQFGFLLNSSCLHEQTQEQTHEQTHKQSQNYKVISLGGVSAVLISFWFGFFSDAKMVLECRSFTLPQQFTPKYREPGNHNSGEDLLRTCGFRIRIRIRIWCPTATFIHTRLIVCRLVEVPVPAAAGFSGLGRLWRPHRLLRVPLPKLRAHPRHRNPPPARW